MMKAQCRFCKNDFELLESIHYLLKTGILPTNYIPRCDSCIDNPIIIKNK